MQQEERISIRGNDSIVEIPIKNGSYANFKILFF